MRIPLLLLSVGGKMNKQEVLKALQELRGQPKRKFSQSVELIINLKNINIKSNPLDFFITLPSPRGKGIKIAAFAGAELEKQAKENCDLVIMQTDFANYDKKKIKKLAQEYDYFVAQATLMPKVAASFGRYLGARGKMPNPKIGCVVPPNANLGPLIEKLNKSVRLKANKGTNLQCLIGKEDMEDDLIAENILSTYKASVKQLPNELQNVKCVLIKTTMGKPIRV